MTNDFVLVKSRGVFIYKFTSNTLDTISLQQIKNVTPFAWLICQAKMCFLWLFMYIVSTDAFYWFCSPRLLWWMLIEEDLDVFAQIDGNILFVFLRFNSLNLYWTYKSIWTVYLLLNLFLWLGMVYIRCASSLWRRVPSTSVIWYSGAAVGHTLLGDVLPWCPSLHVLGNAHFFQCVIWCLFGSSVQVVIDMSEQQLEKLLEMLLCGPATGDVAVWICCQSWRSKVRWFHPLISSSVWP